MTSENFLDLDGVMKATTLSKPTIYELMADGRFPKSFKITERRVAWRECDVAKWQRERMAAAGMVDAA